MPCTTCCVPLYERTLELVRNAPRQISHRMMADACGSTRQWVWKFARDGAENASVAVIQKLHDYLVSVGTN